VVVAALVVLAAVDRVSVKLFGSIMAADIFSSPDRDRFFKSIGFRWYDLPPTNNPDGIPTPYALYHCQQVERDVVTELRTASAAVGQVLLETWQILREMDDEDLEYYGFPESTWNIIHWDATPPWCMRLDWCWNEQTETYKVIEVNSQTPSFWYEPTIGNGLVAAHFGLQSVDSDPGSLLAKTLQVQLYQAAQQLGKPLSHCQVGFTALNNPEDLNTMNWLSSYHPGSKAFPLERMRLDNRQRVYDSEDNQQIDILIMWYPLEWLILDTDSRGEELWPELERLILDKKVALINFGSAFALQSKGVFALIRDMGIGEFSPAAAAAIQRYFPKTAVDEIEIGDSYFAKPIFGRQGEGAVAVIDGEEAFAGNCADPFYTEQPYVYQELLEFPTTIVAGAEMTELWGVWLYYDQGQMVADALGKRLSKSKVTDDGAYWCPIGFAL
jgi:glutathionylspermidine synthase